MGRLGRASWSLVLAVTGGGCGAETAVDPGYLPVSQAQDASPADDAAWDSLVSSSDARYERSVIDASDPGPPYPVVLVHGFSGWKDIQALGIEYFYGVGDALREAGETMVYETQVDPYAATETRGNQLAPQIDQILGDTGKDKVNIIAHSQGGLDSRYIISSLGYGDRVASLTTISTPHRGTRVADLLYDAVPDWTDPIINAIADLLGKSIFDFQSDSDLRASFASLSEPYIQTVFNPNNPNDPRVSYFSYAGRSNDDPGEPDCDGSWIPNDPSVIDHIDPLLSLTGDYLETPGQGVFCPDGECVNDGMVTVASARWGLFMGCFPADHFDEVGQVKKEKPNAESGYDQRVFYVEVVQRLRERGF